MEFKIEGEIKGDTKVDELLSADNHVVCESVMCHSMLYKTSGGVFWVHHQLSVIHKDKVEKLSKKEAKLLFKNMETKLKQSF